MKFVKELYDYFCSIVLFQSTEFLLFGLAMIADMIVLAALAKFYVPMEQENLSETHKQKMIEISKDDQQTST